MSHRLLTSSGAVPLILTVLWMAWWWPILSGETLLYFSDFSQFAIPSKTFWLSRISLGDLPWWTPHASAGMPFLSDPANQSFYPPNAIVLAFDSMQRGLGWFVALHHLGALLGMYALSRVLALPASVSGWVAIVYAFSGYVLSMSYNVTYFPAVAWVPGALACYVATLRWESTLACAGAAGCLCMLLLAGDVLDAGVLICVCAGISAFASIFKFGPGFERLTLRLTLLPERVQPLALWLFMVGVGFLLAGVQLLPAIELYPHSLRSQAMPFAELTQWSFPPARTLEIIQPYFFGSYFPVVEFYGQNFYPQAGRPWAYSVYIGTLTVAAAGVGSIIVGRIALPWLALSVCAVLLAFGAHAPYYEALTEWVPVLDSQRYPEKFVYWSTFPLFILGGFGIAALLQLCEHKPWPADQWRGITRLFFSICVLGLGLLLLVDVPARAWIWNFAHSTTVVWQKRLPLELTHIQALAVHSLFALALVAGLFWVGSAVSRRYIFAIGLLSALDLVWVHSGFVPTAPTQLLTQPLPSSLNILAMPALASSRAQVSPNQKYRVYFDAEFPSDSVLFVNGILKRTILQTLDPASSPADAGYPYIYADMWRGARLQPNGASVHGVEYLNGRISPVQSLEHILFEEILLDRNPSRLMSLSSVRFVVTALSPASKRWAGPGFTEVLSSKELNLRILEVQDTLPRATIVDGAVRILGEFEEQLHALLQAPADASIVVAALSSGAAAVPTRSTPTTFHSVELTRPRPERFEANGVATNSRQLLLINESYLPGWRATVNGQDVPILRANARFMAVPLPKGEFGATVIFSVDSWRSGLAVSTLGVGAISALLVFGWRRNLKRQRTHRPNNSPK